MTNVTVPYCTVLYFYDVCTAAIYVGHALLILARRAVLSGDLSAPAIGQFSNCRVARSELA